MNENNYSEMTNEDLLEKFAHVNRLLSNKPMPSVMHYDCVHISNEIRAELLHRMTASNAKEQLVDYSDVGIHPSYNERMNTEKAYAERLRELAQKLDI
ncbi:MAG: hypothetical protein PHV98_00810 [Candidatus Omnitrophica bacterium]|nr:hypothetical protein [Candidatus Omnitrophota bacterium]